MNSNDKQKLKKLNKQLYDIPINTNKDFYGCKMIYYESDNDEVLLEYDLQQLKEKEKKITTKKI